MDRRHFLKLVTAAGTISAIGAPPPCPPPAPPAPAAPQPPPKPAPQATTAPAAAPPAAKPAAPADQATTAPAPAAAAQAAPKGSVTMVQVYELRPMDPSVEIPSTTNTVLHVYDPLLWKNDDLSLKPHLAKSWSVEDNGTRIRINLQPGVKFSNGDPLLAEDVKFTYDRVKDPKYKSFHTKYVTAVKEVKVVDPQTVDFVLSQYDATLLGRLAMIGIASEKYVKQVGDDDFPSKPMGTGPFKLKEWTKGQQAVFDANMDYWQGPPKVQTIVWKNIGESATRAAVAQAGQADVIEQVAPSLSAQVESGGKVKVVEVHSLRTSWLVMNAY